MDGGVRLSSQDNDVGQQKSGEKQRLAVLRARTDANEAPAGSPEPPDVGSAGAKKTHRRQQGGEQNVSFAPMLHDSIAIDQVRGRLHSDSSVISLAKPKPQHQHHHQPPCLSSDGRPSRVSFTGVVTKQTTGRVSRVVAKKSSLASRVPGYGMVVGVQSSAMAMSMGRSVMKVNATLVRHANSASSVVFGLTFWIALFSGTCFLLYVLKEPVFAEGAFGYATPVQRDKASAAAHFYEARASSVSYGDLSNIFLDQNVNLSAEVINNSTYVWKRIILTYQGPLGVNAAGEATRGPVSLPLIQDIETTLRNLPGWVALCDGVVPESEQRLCAHGDSLATAAFGIAQDPGRRGEAEGVLLNISMDKSGQYQVLSKKLVVDTLRRTHPTALRRWLPNWDGGEVLASPNLRSMFAFYLPEDMEEEWTRLIQDEVEELLVTRQQALLGVDGVTLTMGIFYDIDGIEGLEAREFSRSLQDDLPVLLLGPIGAGVATMLATQRAALSLAAALVAGFACVTAGIGLASEGYDGTKAAVPAVSFAAWNLVAVASADLAAATVRGVEVLTWGIREPEPGPTEDRPVEIKLYGRFLAEAYGPQFNTGISLLVVAAVSAEVPMVSEFSLYAGVGLLCAVFYSFFFLPTALQLGALLGSRARKVAVGVTALREKWMLRMAYNSFSCVECGARHPWRRELTMVVKTFSMEVIATRWLRLLATIACGIVVFVALTLGCWPHFYTGAPRLFVHGHRITEGREARAVYMVPMPGPASIIEDPLGEIFVCSVDAYDSLGCVQHRCNTDFHGRSVFGDPSCDCYYHASDPESGPDAGCRGTALRLFAEGVKDSILNATYWSQLWQWTSDRLKAGGLTLDPDWAGPGLDSQGPLQCEGDDPAKCLGTRFSGGPLSIEDWVSGGTFTYDLVRSSFVANESKAPPLFEEACNRVLCFCGVASCSMETDPDLNSEYTPKVFPGGWTNLCEGEKDECQASMPDLWSSGSRRLAQEPANTTTLSDGPAASEPERLLDITIVVGLETPGGIPYRVTATKLNFSQALRIESLPAQRAALAFCEGTHPSLRIVERHCWAHEFQQWLQVRNRRFPVPPEEFYELLQEHLLERSSRERSEDLQEDPGRFWVDVQGRIRGYYLAFKALAPPDDEEDEYFSQWHEYIAIRNEMLPPVAGHAWMVSPVEVLSEEIGAVTSTTVSSIFALVIVVAGAALLCTFSAGVALAVAALMFLALLFFGAFAVGLGGYSAGAIDIVLLVTYSAGLSPQLLRFAHLWAKSKEASGINPELRWHERFHLQQADFFCGKQQSMSISHGQNRVAPTRVQFKNLIWKGAIGAERQARTAASLARAVDSYMAVLIGAAVCGPILLTSSMEGVFQVGLINFCGCVAALPLALGLLPMLLELGLGPSRTREKAHIVFRTWLEEGCPSDGFLSLPTDVDAHESEMDGMLAAAVLGWPYTALAQCARNVGAESGFVPEYWKLWLLCLVPKCFGGHGMRVMATPSLLRRSFRRTFSSGRFDDELPDEDEDSPQILALDVHGATAMPPFHVVMEVRDKFEVAG